MNRSQNKLPRSLVWKKCLFYLLFTLVMSLLIKGLIHFPLSDKPLLLKDIHFGPSFGLILVFNVWSHPTVSIWQKIGWFLGLMFLSFVVIQGVFGSMPISLWLWLALLIVGAVLLYLYYHFVKPEL
ncbi:hypothetical protein ACMZ6Z_09140 [Streptococcus pluranimalium]|uniref:hypothetical protein n=1 Tax=Streptococcus pluranimalium TaxID=82348 RepID=UPI0039FBE0F5